MTTEALTERQTAALAIIDKNGASYVGAVNRANVNHVDHRSVAALVRMGLVEVFAASDGRFVKRRTIDADMLGTLANALEVA